MSYDSNPTELITIEQNFPYHDPETAGYKPNWKLYCQVHAELQIDQGRIFWAAQKNNSELKGIAITKQYIKGLTNDKEFRIKCSQGYFPVMIIIDLRHKNANELHLRRVNT